jgi:hypothetical protein
LARCRNHSPWLKGHSLQCRRLRELPWELRLLALRHFLLAQPRRHPAIWPRFLPPPVLLPEAVWLLAR